MAETLTVGTALKLLFDVTYKLKNIRTNNKIIARFSPYMRGFDSRLFLVKFVVNTVAALGQVSFPVLWGFSPYHYHSSSAPYCEPGSSVGITTGYGLDGPGIESRWRRDFPHLSRPALGQWVPSLSRG